MRSRAKQWWVAAIGGLLAACLAILIGATLFGQPLETDGSFVLEEPGIFQEPVDEVNPDQTGAKLPALDLPDASGQLVALDDYLGTPLVINVWYSWCAPCARELADFAVVDAATGEAVTFIGINPFDTERAMVEFAAERDVAYDLLRDPQREFSQALSIIGYPATFFVDESGNIVAQRGELTAEELYAELSTHFGITP